MKDPLPAFCTEKASLKLIEREIIGDSKSTRRENYENHLAGNRIYLKYTHYANTQNVNPIS